MRNRARVLLVLAVVLTGACARGTGRGEAVTPVDVRVQIGTVEVPMARLATLRVAPDEPLVATGFLAGEVAQAAAAALAEPAVTRRLVDGPATGVACTEIYGGPDVAHVTGRIGDDDVDTIVDRTDGCGIDDWELLLALLGPPLWSEGGEGTYGDVDHPVSLPVGEVFEVRLESNPSTGYAWVLEVSGPAVVRTGERYEEPDGDLVGAAGHQVFELRVAGSGTSVLALTYERSFEPDVAPIDTRTFHVEAAV